jgi:sugar lactone lactonase YvrE
MNIKWIDGVRLHGFFFMVIVLGLLLATGCSEDNEETSTPAGASIFVEKMSGDNQVGETGRELPDPIVVRVYDEKGLGVEGATVAFEVAGGGGTLSESSVLTDSDGEASVRWTLGAPPVWNRVRASVEGHEVGFVAWANPGEKPELQVLLQGGGVEFANEDLAFGEGRGLFLGSPGAILNIPSPGGGPVEIDLTGESIESPAGIAFGTTGDLYVCENADPGKSVKRVRPSGESGILSEGFGSEPFALPNHMAVHSSGDIYLSSTCDQMIYRISPVDGATTEFLSIPGPNGLAFDAQETHLYILIENPAVFCFPSPSVRGGLYRVPLGPDGEPGDLEPLVEGFALAGDGLAFDEEGNLYTVFSGDIKGRPGGFDDSGVFVYTPDGRFHEFFSVNILEGEIITNIAFGVEPFDPDSLYCYGFTGRLYRVEVGIRGRRLP